jgi:hypothetical protein
MGEPIFLSSFVSFAIVFNGDGDLGERLFAFFLLLFGELELFVAAEALAPSAEGFSAEGAGESFLGVTFFFFLRADRVPPATGEMPGRRPLVGVDMDDTSICTFFFFGGMMTTQQHNCNGNSNNNSLQHFYQ